jgi:prepilin-type N-terminal cleavage/methylation domain-containing protein
LISASAPVLIAQKHDTMTRGQRGFSLIDVAIVMVILGLLIGAVLKGQELVVSARVRNLIRQQDGLKIACSVLRPISRCPRRLLGRRGDHS